MIASDALVQAPAVATRQTSQRWVVAWHTLRSTHRGALIWGAVFGLFVVSSVTAYITGFPTQTERQQLARTLQTFSILLGPPRNADTVAGFTQWRVLLVAGIMGAIWGMLTSTSRLRGEEENGRWELLLAGPLTKRAATLQVLVGLGGAWLLMFGTTALLVLLSGRLPGARFPVTGSLLLAAAMTSGAAMWLAMGAVASQVSATRGQALRICAALLGASFLVRMLADSRTSLGWLRWLSPLGWLEEVHPLRSPQPLALLPVLAVILGCCAVAIWLAEWRDLNASLLQEGTARRHETAWSAGILSLAIRITQPAAIGWLLGAGVLSLVTGV
ncbi:MAG TPA: ABC transporter permease subunit, partial [Chloroflexota bacterium]|nr:ABC transporter permease subunit [Chloroflexota bacterium]